MTARPPLVPPPRPPRASPARRAGRRWTPVFAAGSTAVHAAALAALVPWAEPVPRLTAGGGNGAIEMVFLSAPAESGTEAEGTAAPPPPDQAPPPVAPAPAPPAAAEAPTAQEQTEPQQAALPPDAAPLLTPLSPAPAAPPPARRPAAAPAKPSPATSSTPAARSGPADAAPEPTDPAEGDTASATASTTEARAFGPGLRNPQPDYPRAAQRRDIEGRVVLDVTVSPEGLPLAVELAVSSGSPLLDEAAARVVRDRWRFEPARRGETPVVGRIRVPIDFRLTDD